jgi:glycosyltransferase involved in cell wall biosynthesis
VRVRADGKHFSTEAGRYAFRGVTYGTFRPRDGDIARFPPPSQVERDLAAMREAGFNVVRTYTPPPPDVLELAAGYGLHLLPDAFYPDWRYTLGSSRREQRRIAREARTEVRSVARRLAGREAVLALSLGNEIPADVLRWVGTERIAALIEELAEVVRDEDPELLVTYANYPTAEYLPLAALDFLTFNVFLEQKFDLRRYLTRLHHLAGDRPLVLAEIGLDAGTTPAGEQRQAETLDWQMETALDRAVAGTCIFSWTDEWWVGDSAVEGWHFGLTRADRSARPALEVAQRWNGRTVASLNFEWPSMSVVICAYNAAQTLDECLSYTAALNYPGLEVIVVNDGSTDDTASIARRYDGVRLVEIEHSGLSVARNEGFRVARGDLVAYLDSDAYPTPEWPYYLALAFDGPTVGGAGGPNIVPREDPLGAQRVARAPGGPLHVLVGDDRAEHVPGCNMAFWRKVLQEVGGFDPIYQAAGDDVDLCWRVLDRRWEIAFHPGAMVWHHARPGTRRYLRQQRGYGRAEALVEARHPDRFSPAGTARWRGRIYDSFAPRLSRQRVYHGTYGTAAYQSVYRGGGQGMDLAHQIGVPLALPLLATAALAPWWPLFAIVSLVAALAIGALFVVDALRARPPHRVDGHLRFRCGVALLHMLQPLARAWGRARHRTFASKSLQSRAPLPGPVERIDRKTLLFPEDGPRDELAACLVTELRRARLRIVPSTGWEDYDARVLGSALVQGDLVTSSYPIGYVQLRVRRRARLLPALWYVAALLLAVLAAHGLAVVVLLLAVADTSRGLWRTGSFTRRTIEAAAAASGAGAPAEPVSWRPN